MIKHDPYERTRFGVKMMETFFTQVEGDSMEMMCWM